MDKHIEPETGLHNLLPPKQKAAKLKELVMRDFSEYYQSTLSFKKLDDSTIKEAVEVFIDTCLKYYNNDYRIAFSGVVREGEKRMMIYPMNLTSFILFCGFDLPPTNLKEYGGWEGENHIYTITAPANTIDMPVAKLEDKLNV